jgi:UrcA family protein
MASSERRDQLSQHQPNAAANVQQLTLQEIAMKNFFTLASIIVLGFATANVANADPQSPQSLTVHFGDLNLNNAQGVDALFKRIKNAAESVCNEFEGRTLKEKRLYSDCVDTALSTAIARVDRPALSRYVVDRSAKPRNTSVPVASTR